MWKLNSALVLQLAAAAANQKTDPDVDIKSPYPSDGSSNNSSVLSLYIKTISPEAAQWPNPLGRGLVAEWARGFATI